MLTKAELEREYDQKFKRWQAEQTEQSNALPTQTELAGFRARFNQLCDELRGGGLKSSPKLPIERKVLVFLLSITGAAGAKEVTKAKWDKFFTRVEAQKKETLLGLSWLELVAAVNKANGLDAGGKPLLQAATETAANAQEN